MVFAVSEGKLLAVQKPSYQAPSALRLSDDMSQDYATLYRKQANVRTVVDFLARNVAQLSLHTFERRSDNGRERVSDHPFARLMRQPNAHTTGYRLMRDLIADRGIYDRALWVKARDKDDNDILVRVPPRLWSISEDDSWLAPSGFVIKGNRGKTTIPADRCVYFRGYNPEDERYGLSPIESLRQVLSEEFAAGQMREQSLRNGARIGGYITRPAGAAWSDTARQRFGTSWRAQYAGQTATEGGGTPVLEDGMQFVAAGHSAEDMQYIEARKLSREEVAASYFIPPPMVGILDHATFGNIEEQHKMLYQDTLGPILQEVQQEIMLQILRADFGADADDLYVEFNMLEKLRGSFEEQVEQLQKATGAPFLSRAEARSRMNLPYLDGTDELVVPLNVLIGGQASPTDQAEPGAGGGSVEDLKAIESRLTKARPSTPQITKGAQVLSEFFERQERSVRSALGAKSAEWWDAARWDRELAGVLLALSSTVTEDVARKQLERLGVDPDDYDVARTLAWLTAVSGSVASSINATTEKAIAGALADDGVDGVGHVFEVAKSSRAEQGAKTFTTALAGFASVEAVKQVRGSRGATKTWNVTSGNPRASHAALNGETVPIDSVFSNGAKWPGDGVLNVDEVAGCTCEVDINLE
jgi:HK97 family phage portal protein